MRKSLLLAYFCLASLPAVRAQSTFSAVPELPYRVVTEFFKFPKNVIPGEAAGVAVNSKGHIYLFQRTKPMLAEYDDKGNFVQSIGEGLFMHPHGLRVDADDNLWTTDDGSNSCSNWTPPVPFYWSWDGSVLAPSQTGCSTNRPMWPLPKTETST